MTQNQARGNTNILSIAVFRTLERQKKKEKT